MARRPVALASVATIAVFVALLVLLLGSGVGSAPASSATAGLRSPTLASTAILATASPAAAVSAATPAPAATRAVDPESGLPAVRRADLPPEARATLALIAAGGPFPYQQDGTTYRNLERILPVRPPGYYREYTVETPGSPDRGARRIVTGRGGESYWTADHYASFSRILP